MGERPQFGDRWLPGPSWCSLSCTRSQLRRRNSLPPAVLCSSTKRTQCAHFFPQSRAQFGRPPPSRTEKGVLNGTGCVCGRAGGRAVERGTHRRCLLELSLAHSAEGAPFWYLQSRTLEGYCAFTAIGWPCRFSLLRAWRAQDRTYIGIKR